MKRFDLYIKELVRRGEVTRLIKLYQKGENIIPKLIKLLDNEDEDVRANAIEVLAEIAEVNPEAVKPAIPKLIELLNDEDGDVRANAAWVLGEIAKVGPELIKPAIQKLMELLEDVGVRASAAWTLAEIAEVNPELVKPAVPKLIKLLDDKDGWVCANAIEVLGNIGAEEALEPLKKLLNDTSFVIIDRGETLSLRDVVEETIKKIENKKKENQSDQDRGLNSVESSLKKWKIPM